MSDLLPYVIRQPKKPSKTPSLLILLHGYGSNELDLFSFSDELPDDLLIVSLRAPYEIGHGGYAWYAIDLDSENNKFSDLFQARESMHKIAAAIDDLKIQHKTNPTNTFLLGFSQGAIPVSYTHLTLPTKRIV